MKTLLGLVKTMPSPLTVIPLLGISIDVTLRLKNVKDEKLKEIDSAIKVDPNYLGSITKLTIWEE